MATAEKVKVAFDDLGFDLEDAKVTDRLCSLCDAHRVDEEKVSCEYLAFLSRKRMPITCAPTLEILDDFDLDLAKHLQDFKRQKDVVGAVTGRPVHEDGDIDDDSGALSFYGTPIAAQKRQVSPSVDASSGKRRAGVDSPIPISGSTPKTPADGGAGKKYAARTNAGKIMIRYGDEILSSSSAWRNSTPFEPQIKVLSNKIPENYRFMFERLRQRAGHLDETICRVGDHLTTSLHLEPQPFNHVMPEPFDAIGRVCCDADGRLNSKSIVLQGSMDLCGGKVVALDPSGVEEYSLFPGQIIHARASNPSGHRLMAEVINSDCSPGASKDPKIGQDVHVVVASGPYTTSDNLWYEPLSDLLRYISDHRPHLVVLCGPFVDVKVDSVEETFEEVFSRVMRMIEECAKDLITEFVVVASHRDAHHRFIYPTPPFVASTLGNVKMMADPCVVSVDGIKFGITSTDILFHLGKEEISHPPRSGDRLRRLATHLIRQRSFYPLYPSGDDMNVDLEQLERVGQMEEQPHILILPSDLLHFFKDINGCLALNPQRLSRGEGGGVFARLKIKAGDNAFSKRVAGEIVRI